MKCIIGSGFPREIYEWLWFSKLLNICALKISAVRLYSKVSEAGVDLDGVGDPPPWKFWSSKIDNVK